MTTTPPPMPEPKWPFGAKYSVLDVQARDAQWMERITALEAENARLREALQNLYDRFDPYAVPGMEKNEAVAEAARAALKETP